MEFKNTLLATSAAVALCASSAAHADSYFTVFGGATFQSDLDARATHTATKAGLSYSGLKYVNYAKYLGIDASAELESGFVLGAAYGRNLNPSWRMELEMAYRENQVEQNASFMATKVAYASFSTIGGKKTGATTIGPKYSSGTKLPVEGSTSFFSVMANVWYDFSIAGPWETFVGAGIGMAQANVNDFQIGYGGTKTYDIADGSDWVFAYQFGVGAGYTLDNGIRLSAQYRYFGTDEVEIDGVNLQGEANEFLFGISFPLGN